MVEVGRILPSASILPNVGEVAVTVVKWGRAWWQVQRDVTLLVEIVRGLVVNQEIGVGELCALKQRVDQGGGEPPPGGQVIPLRRARQQQQSWRRIELSAAAVLLVGMVIGLGTVAGPGGRPPAAQAAGTLPGPQMPHGRPASSTGRAGAGAGAPRWNGKGQQARPGGTTSSTAANSPAATTQTGPVAVPADVVAPPTSVPAGAPATTSTTLPDVTTTTLLPPVTTLCLPDQKHDCKPDD